MYNLKYYKFVSFYPYQDRMNQIPILILLVLKHLVDLLVVLDLNYFLFSV